MKKTLLFCAFMLTAAVSPAQFKNASVFIKDYEFVTDRVEISYGFENCDPTDRYMVWIEAKTFAGKRLEVKSLEGDIENVAPSPNRKLTWFTSRDGVVVEEKIQLVIYAMRQPNMNLGKAYGYSTLFPGAGHKQVGGSNKLYLGAIGYAGIAGAIAFNGMAASNLDKYATESDPAKAKQFYDDAKAFRTYSLSCIGVSAVAWGVNYFLLNKSAKRTKSVKPQQIIINPPPGAEMLVASSEIKFISTRGLPPNLFADLSFKDDNGNGILEAGEKAEIAITVTNQGKGNAYEMRVSLIDDKPAKSLTIGNEQQIPLLKPGETQKVIFPISTDINLTSAEHKIEIKVTEKYGYDMDPAFLNLQTFEYQHAKLSFSGIEILDAGEGTAAISEDGQLQAGEMVKAKIVVQNTGQGISTNTRFTVTTTDNNIFLRDNSGSLGTLNPGEVREIFFTLSPNKRVVTTGNLPVLLEMSEDKGKGDLLAFQLPVKLNQKPPKPNIKTINADLESLTKNIAVFEYTSNKFTANTSTIINIRSVAPSLSERKNAVAVVFGVSKYEDLAPAPYAANDADIMKEYFEKILGIGQVLVFTNEEVTIGKLNKVFNPNYGELQKAIVKGETDVFVFFSGHGVPDKTGENTYLLPYDGLKEDLETFGYNTSKLYNNLSLLGARSVTVILDACFSGGSRKTEKIPEENLIAQKGVKVKVQKPWLAWPDFTVINSSTGEETSLGFDASETGLFTYFFAAGLQGKADENADKKITLGELKKYVTDNVTATSRRISGLQTPEFHGDDNLILVEY